MAKHAAGPALAPPILKTLFPAGVSIAWTAADVPANSLHPAERPATRGMAPPRLQTFAKGRACARRALTQLGLTESPVPVGEQRAPLWPAGICGSIAHDAGQAVAVVARRELCQSLGIDMATPGDLAPEVLALVCTAPERDALARPAGAGLGTALFAVKESVYKCIWPLCRRYIDFQEISCELDLSTGRYLARAESPTLDAEIVHAVRGGWCETGGLIYASAYLLSAPAL